MTNQRKGEIAVMFMKKQMRGKPLHVPGINREAANLAKEFAITYGEMAEFLKLMICELTEETLKSLEKVPTTQPEKL